MYFLPLLVLLIGMSCYVYGTLVFSWPTARPPYSSLDDVLWSSFWFFSVTGTLGSLITIPLYLVHRKARAGEGS